MRKVNLLLVVILLITLLFPTQLQAQSIEDLQAAIDKSGSSTRATTVSEIDLSDYSSVKFTKSLYVKNGKRIRFVNGTLTASDTYDGPIVTVQAGGYLELPSSVKMTGNYDLTHPKGLVNVTCGELRIIGASLEVSRVGAGPISSRGVVVSSPSDDSSVSKYSTIIMESGHVYGQIGLNNKNDYLYLSGGSASYITTQEQNVTVILTSSFSSAVGFASYSERMACLNILYQIHYPITIRTQGSVYEGDVIARGYDGYQLTEADLKKVTFSPKESEGEWETYLEDNCIKVRKVSAFDLQAELDKVAAAGTSTYEKPTTITIPEGGILITKWISVPEKCHALLTGGPIRIELQGGHSAFYLNGSIHLKEISIGCNKNGYSGFDDYFMGNGKLKVDYNTTFINNNIENPTGLFYQLSGAELEYRTNDVFKSSKHMVLSWDESIIKMYGSTECRDIAIDAPKSTVTVFWGTVASAGDYVIRCKDIIVTETGTTIKSLREDASSVVLIEAEIANYITGDYIGEGSRIIVKKEAAIYGNLAMPTIKLEKDATITIKNNLQHPITIEGDWQDFTIGKPVVYCDVKDTAFVSFAGPLPSGVKVMYYKKEGAFIFYDLQWLMDNQPIDNIGDDDKPIDIPVPCEGVNLDEDLLFDKLQAEMDGVAYEDDCKEDDNIKLITIRPHCNCDIHPIFPHIKVWNFKGNTTIGKSSCITLRNLYLDGLDGTKRIYVEGTLIIDVYVYFTRFKDYAIHIRPGGRVIWRGGWTETIEKVIYNEGGTITIEGGYIYDGGKGGNVIVNIDGTINIQNDSDGVPTYIHGRILNGDNGHKSGTITICDGSYEGCITNYGTLVIDGGDINGMTDYGIRNYGECYFKGGTSTGKDNVGIWSYTNIHLCGCANVGEVYLRGGSTIYVTERLTVKIRINVFIDGDLKDGAFIIVGGDGYTLMEDDLKLLELVLPDGYEWEYDSSQHAIIIKSSTGINGVEMDGNADPSDVYSLKGVKIGTTADKSNIPEGIYIIDGKKTNITPRL